MPDVSTASSIKDERPNQVGFEPAIELAEKSAQPYPNDNAEYRIARTLRPG